MNNLELIEAIPEYKDFMRALLNMTCLGFFDKEADFEKSKERAVECVKILLLRDLEEENAD